jgi:excisionase family DNA binding protein
MNSLHRLSSKGSAWGRAGMQPARDGRRATFFTVADVAVRLNVCERTIRRWIAAGTLPVHRFGRLVRVSETDLVAFLALNRDA